MLIGEYTHTIDAKKRLSLPARFRKELGKKVVVTRGLDTCLFMYPEKAWEKMASKLGELSMGSAESRALSRFILAGAAEEEVDAAGRILVPDFLKEFANLRGKVVLAGVGDRVEIWSEKAWEEQTRRIEKQADQVAQKLSDLRAI